MKAWPNSKKSGEHFGTPLDLSGFEVTFSDEFNRMSVTDEKGKGPWFAPVHSDFGGAHFVAPRKGAGPIFVRNGKLVIQMFRENGKLLGGLAQTVTADGHGFAQQYGYFEARVKFPLAKPVWGAFWLHSHPRLTGPKVTQTEVDVVEAYGDNPVGHHKAVHLWPVKDTPEGDVKQHAHTGVYNKVEGQFDGFHTHGVLITPEVMVFYYDRKELVRMPTPPEVKTPQYMLLNLTAHPKFAHLAEGVAEMEVDYVRVWQKKGGY